MANYFINRESCWVSPVCVDLGSSTQLSVSSLKLAARGACGRVLVVLVIDDTVVYEATFDSPATGLLSFVPPPHILQTIGVLVAYVVLCDAEGRISEVVECGKTLVFPKDAATEVRALFGRICSDVKQFFKSSLAEPERQVHCQAHAPQQQDQQQQISQQRQQQGRQQPLLPALRRALLDLLRVRRCSGSTVSGDNRDSPLAGSANVSNSCGSEPPDAATLYAYEHFLLPFLRHWAAVLKPNQATVLQPESSNGTHPVAVHELAVRLLHFMLNNEMWASAVLLLDRHPALSEHVVNSGLELPGDFCNPLVLEDKRRSHRLLPIPPVTPLLHPVQLQQQHAALMGQQMGSTAAAANAAPMLGYAQPHLLGTHLINASGFGILDYAELSPASPNSENNDESSYESASEILRRLLEPQQRLEQEAVEQEYLQQQFLQQQNLNDGQRAQQQGSDVSRGQTNIPAQASSVALASAAAVADQLNEADDGYVGLVGDSLEVGSAGDIDSHTGDFALAPSGRLAALQSTDPEQERTMVPKHKPPRPLHQTLERESCLEAGVMSKAMDINLLADGAPAATLAELSTLQQQQQLWQQHAWQQQQQQDVYMQQQHFAQRNAAAVAAAAPVHYLPADVAVEASAHPFPAAAEHAAHPVLADIAAPLSNVSEVACKQTAVNAGSAISAVAVQAAVEAAATQPMAPQSSSKYGSCNPSDSYSNKQFSSTACDEADCRGSSSIRHKPCSSIKGKQVEWYSSCSTANRSPVGRAPASFMQQFSTMLHASFLGFQDGWLEQSYLVFKNHSAGVLDTTALLICSGMLLATTTRSVDYSNDPQCWAKLALLLLYGAAFFFPYAIMRSRRQVFLRNREILLVISRSLAAFVVMLVALGWVPQPDAWMKVVDNTLAMQLQNGFILPSCQQLRPYAAAVIALAHLPSDMFMLGLGQPLATAFMQSLLVQLCSVVTTVVLDIWCRHRFMQRYLGVAGSVPVGPEQQTLTKNGCRGSNGSCSVQQSGISDKADAALRQRRLQQLQ